jgi:hypothetical protein
MKLYLTGLLSIFFLLGNIKAQSRFTVALNIPEVLESNTTVGVLMEIEKPADMTSYASFKQVVPPGFSLKAKEMNGANFLFENNELNITWLRLPTEEKISVSWEMTVKEGIIGIFEFGGTFNYLIDNSQGSLELEKNHLEVIKNRSSSNSDNNKTYNPDYVNRLRSEVKCDRKIEFNEIKKYYTVEIILIVQNVRRYSIVEKIPEGYSFKELEHTGAELNVLGTTIQYFVSNIHPGKVFSIKYILIPVETTLNITPPVYGKLAFIAGDQIINLSILNKK